MRKGYQRVGEMSNAVLVDEMAKMSDALVRDEVRGPGDYINAMRRLSNKHRVPYSHLFDLKYRKPKKPDPISFTRVYQAYVALRERQLQQFRDDLERTTKDAGTTGTLARAAIAVAGKGALADSEAE